MNPILTPKNIDGVSMNEGALCVECYKSEEFREYAVSVVMDSDDFCGPIVYSPTDNEDAVCVECGMTA